MKIICAEMNAQALLEMLASMDVTAYQAGDCLILNGPPHVVDESLASEVRPHLQELLQALRQLPPPEHDHIIGSWKEGTAFLHEEWGTSVACYNPHILNLLYEAAGEKSPLRTRVRVLTVSDAEWAACSEGVNHEEALQRATEIALKKIATPVSSQPH